MSSIEGQAEGASQRRWPGNGWISVNVDKELKKLVRPLDEDRVKQSKSDKGVQWLFSPLAVQHSGAVISILDNVYVTDKELLTAFAGVEGLINSKP